MKVHCQFPSTKEIYNFDIVNKNTSIQDLKNIIYYRTGTPINNQVIELGNKRLSTRHNYKKLSRLNINENSNLRMVYSLEGGAPISGCSCQIL